MFASFPGSGAIFRISFESPNLVDAFCQCLIGIMSGRLFCFAYVSTNCLPEISHRATTDFLPVSRRTRTKEWNSKGRKNGVYRLTMKAPYKPDAKIGGAPSC
jgi:hypothetical protein